jgi:hypothetical protein
MINQMRSVAFLMALLAAALVLACGDDPVKPPVACSSCSQNLTHKTDVLSNIEYAYNRQQTNVYDALLDDAFTFFYTEGDVGGGTVVQWGRDVESSATAGLLGAASSIDLDITWEDGVTWIEVPAGAETWYSTTVFYHFLFKIGDTIYIPNSGAKAEFTVRNTGTDEKPHWMLVEFTDLGGPSLVSVLERTSTSSTSWGKVKALYR